MYARCCRMKLFPEKPLCITLTLLLLVPFSYKLMHHLKPFAIVDLNGEITVYSVDFPKWFWMVHVGQLIQNLVWIFPNGSTANTKPCLDTSKWWINGPSKTIWMYLNGTCSTALLHTVQMVSPCVYKTNGHFWKWKFWMVLNGLSVGGLRDDFVINCIFQRKLEVLWKSFTYTCNIQWTGKSFLHVYMYTCIFKLVNDRPNIHSCVHYERGF